MLYIYRKIIYFRYKLKVKYYNFKFSVSTSRFKSQSTVSQPVLSRKHNTSVETINTKNSLRVKFP